MLSKHLFNLSTKVPLLIQYGEDVFQVDNTSAQTESFLVYLYLLNEAHFEEIIIKYLQIRLERHWGVSLSCEIDESLAQSGKNFAFVVLVVL